MFKLRRARILGLAALCLSTTAFAVPDRPADTVEQLLSQLQLNTGGQLFDSTDDKLGYRMLHARGAQPLLQDNTKAAPLERARFFLSVYGRLLGVTDPIADLITVRSSRDGSGNTHIHMAQTYQGIPVFGARLVVHLNKAGVTGVNGVFLKNLNIGTTPALSEDQARAAAIALAQKLHAKSALHTESSRLVIYRSDILNARQQGRTYLAYEVVVSAGPSTGVRERYLIDAANGGQIDRIDGIERLLNRAIHVGTEALPVVVAEGSALAPSDPPLVNDDRSASSSRVPPVPPGPLSNLYIFAGGTYNLYKNMFGREGYDDGYIDPVTGMPKVQVQNSTYLINEQCPNAYWDGVGTNYCPAFDADDVVSHEWSHAYTEYTHGLYYQWQAGALNESYSDIFGETYDLVNGIEGPLGITLTEGAYHSDGGSRWVVGEDLTDVVAEVLLRDMWDPDNFTLPGGIPNPLATQAGKVTSPNYSCTGEPHSNSGVPNHTYAILVDGKDYNGVTVPGIGIVKAAHVYFQAETHYQTPSTNFAQHADALEQACADLIGQPLNDPTGAVSADVISAADCDAVHLATVATELRTSDKDLCGYAGTLLQPEDTTPQVCSAPTPYESPDFSENWEGGSLPTGWAVSQNKTGDAAYVPNWTVTDHLPAPHTGFAAFGINYSHGGSPNSGGDVSSSIALDSPEVTIADDQSYLKFTHYVLTESYDGGNVMYSLNGAGYVVVPGTAMTYNPYSGTLPAAAVLPISDPTGLLGSNTNPKADQEAWFGTDNGENSSEWGTTIVDLKKLGLKSGDKVKFRWEFGQDATGGDFGWMVDDLSVMHCSATAPPGTVDPTTPEPPPPVVSHSRFGGALGGALLLPLGLIAALRRRRVH